MPSPRPEKSHRRTAAQHQLCFGQRREVSEGMINACDPVWGDRVRGLLLGLALGDSWERASGSFPRRGAIEVGVGTQLAAFTVDGLVRAFASSGTIVPGQVAPALWNGIARWGAQQGIVVSNAFPGMPVPDGWISSVPALGERRGSAPATVSTLRGGRPGRLEEPVNNSGGTQAVLRTLPTAVVRRVLPYDSVYGEVDAEFASYAALTHGGDAATYASVVTASVASGCLMGLGVSEAVGASSFCVMGSHLGAARDLAVGRPRHPGELRRWMSGDAVSAMAGGVYTAISFPEPGDVLDALAFASRLPGGRGLAAVAGALVWAVHGVYALPVEFVSRLELSWVLDTLARDLVDRVCGVEVAADRYPTSTSP